MDKFLGVGLINAFGLWLLFVLLTVGMKVILTKHPIDGVSEIIQAV